MDFYNFYMGNEFEAYRYLGAHFVGGTTTFRTFAPKASKIAVIGEFNGWTETPMNKVYDGNFWECVIPNTKEGQMYKYRIYKAHIIVENPIKQNTRKYDVLVPLRIKWQQYSV